jgi:carbonic anhydrase/acetyltransferase-like protein (isoleucine patch superfamily)
MTIQTFEGVAPTIANDAYIAPTAVVIGNVTIGAGSSVWPMAVIRGDINTITIGERTSIQDGTVIHVNHAGAFNPTGNPTQIGNDVTIGHKVVLHGCTIHDRSLIGIGSIVMDDVIVESEVIVGAGSLVPPGKRLESGYLWLGSPVKKIRPLTEKEREFFLYSANYYAQLQRRHQTP